MCVYYFNPIPILTFLFALPKYNWRPIEAIMDIVRKKFGSQALFFYNHLCPEVIAILWRPSAFANQPFSAMTSEFARPICDHDWKNDTMVTNNMHDILREIGPFFQNVVTDTKVLDDRSIKREKKGNKKRPAPEVSDSSSESSSDEAE